jgi:acylaminoacyl-peptidase
LAGFLVILPAYPGSTGFGQDYIESLLPPALGTAEVDGTLASLDALRQMGLLVSPERTLLVGSSHGGFIGAHAAGRYPGVFAGMVLMSVDTILSALCATDAPRPI